MSIFGFEISKDLFKHGILQIIGRPVTDDKGIFRQGWSFGRISTLNALDQPKSTYSSGIVKPFHTSEEGSVTFSTTFSVLVQIS